MALQLYCKMKDQEDGTARLGELCFSSDGPFVTSQMKSLCLRNGHCLANLEVASIFICSHHLSTVFHFDFICWVDI